ncbi:MAG: PAS domain S-box protein [Acidobacteria bacterium]|nr:PAS domain S-box protein [Acidobacteriota bacterium]
MLTKVMAVLRILNLEDNPTDTELIEAMLKREAVEFEMVRVASQAAFDRALDSATFDLIISDFTIPSFPSFDGMAALKAARQRRPNTPFIFFSGTMGEDMAVESLKIGATDYILKHRPEKLIPAIRRALREQQDRRLREETQEALEQREKWFRALTENALDIVTVLDAEGHFKYNSPSIERVLGYSPNELVGRKAFELVHDEDVVTASNLLQEAIAHPSRRLTSEFRFRHKSGSWCTLEVVGQNLLSDPAIAGVVINSRDITARRQAEEQYRSIFNNAIEGICQTTPAGRFITANPALVEMLGFGSASELFDKVIDIATQIYANPEDRREFKQRMEQQGFVKAFECPARKRDGTEIWISINARAIRNAQGTATSYDCSITNITERNKAQERIREQAALLDEAHDAICVTDMEHRILYWNRGAESLYGWPRFEALGKRAEELLNPEQAPFPSDVQASLLETGRWESELVQVTKAGNQVIVETRWTLLRDSNSKPKSILIISADITEKKTTEAQFLRAQRIESIGALASGIAHDLNNVLAPILMATEMLRDQVSGDEGTAVIEMIGENVQRGADMVKQILSFARGVSGESSVFDPRHLVRDITQLLRASFPRSIQIQIKLADNLQQITGNVTQLHQVLMNLCVNARDAMPEGGVLRLEAENVRLDAKRTPMRTDFISGEFVRLTVSDTGEGIPTHLLDKIFDPFFTTKEEGRGTGLGLPTVRSIAHSHGGFVEVISQEAKGATFHVFLPATTGEPSRPRHADQAQLPTGHRELILLVDDEAALLEISKLNLEAFNYQVVTARDGAAGLSVYRSHAPEIKLVLTDLTMPIMGGAALVKALRQADPQMKIILASGVGSRSQVIEVENLHVQGFLSKPYTTETLLKTVSSVLYEVRANR